MLDQDTNLRNKLSILGPAVVGVLLAVGVVLNWGTTPAYALFAIYFACGLLFAWKVYGRDIDPLFGYVYLGVFWLFFPLGASIFCWFDPCKRKNLRQMVRG